MTLNLLDYYYHILNILIERQKALHAQEILFDTLNKINHQLFFQNICQNNERLKTLFSTSYNNNFNNSHSNFMKNTNAEEIGLTNEKKIETSIDNIVHANTKVNYQKNESEKNLNYDENKKIFSCKFEKSQNIIEKNWIDAGSTDFQISEKMFKCDFQNCEKAYKSKENLFLHKKNKHLGIKPYGCKFCEAQFSHRNGILNFYKIFNIKT